MNRLSPFFALLIIVPAIHFFLFKPVWENGLGPDDWGLLYSYKSLVGGNNPLFKLDEVWHVRGMYTTHQVYYIGLLEKTFGLNYFAFQIVNILFKTIAALSVYLLVKTIFKKRSLAFLATVLFAISYTSTGTFKFVVQGVDYLALASMNVFLITYFYSIKRFRYSILLSPLLFISLLLSPPRIYPLLFFVPIIESCLIFFSKKKIRSIIKGFYRLIFIFAPLLVVALSDWAAVSTHFIYLEYLSQRLAEGKWHLFLNPLSGLSIYFMPFKFFLLLFGNQGINFSQYFIAVLPKYLLFISLISALVSKLISKSPKAFFNKLLFANLINVAIFFFLIKYNTLDYDLLALTAQLLGAFILELALFAYLEWKNSSQRVDSLLLPIWMGVGLSFIFLFFTWVIAYGQVYKGIHNYLMIPSMGLSLFLAAILLLLIQNIPRFTKVVSKSIITFYKLSYVEMRRSSFLSTKLYFLKRKVFHKKRRYYLRKTLITTFIYKMIRLMVKKGSYVTASLLILFFFGVSKHEINDYFIDELTGWKASDQIMVQKNILKQIKGFLREPALFFFDLSEESSNYRFYEVAALSTFINWTNYSLGTNENSSCRAIFYHFEKERLLELVFKTGNSIKLKANAYCISKGVSYFQNIEFDLDHFYAYKIKDKLLIDEKDEIVEYLLNVKK